MIPSFDVLAVLLVKCILAGMAFAAWNIAATGVEPHPNWSPYSLGTFPKLISTHEALSASSKLMFDATTALEVALDSSPALLDDFYCKASTEQFRDNFGAFLQQGEELCANCRHFSSISGTIAREIHQLNIVFDRFPLVYNEQNPQADHLLRTTHEGIQWLSSEVNKSIAIGEDLKFQLEKFQKTFQTVSSLCSQPFTFIHCRICRLQLLAGFIPSWTGGATRSTV